jgi:transcriptional regulator with XRE-family HTH domain
MTGKKSANPTDAYVGKRVRMRRMMLGMSQTDLAKGVSLTFQQIQKYEKGTNRIGASRMQQFANILAVPVAFFFEGAPGSFKQNGDTSPSPAYVDDFLATHDGLAIVKAFTKIGNAKTRRKIVDLVEQIAEAA